VTGEGEHIKDFSDVPRNPLPTAPIAGEYVTETFGEFRVAGEALGARHLCT